MLGAIFGPIALTGVGGTFRFRAQAIKPVIKAEIQAKEDR
jgi:hypothetical protein